MKIVVLKIRECMKIFSFFYASRIIYIYIYYNMWNLGIELFEETESSVKNIQHANTEFKLI